jgi:hypothetical protein
MLVHQRPLVAVEAVGLVQHAVGHADLADVVEQRGRLDVGDLGALKTEPARDRDRQPLDGVGVLARVAVARLQRERQRPHHRVMRLGDALVLELEGLERRDQRQLAVLQAERGSGRLAAQVLQTT